MCDIQYKGQLSKEQVRERVGKYPLEDPATQEDLQHLADALDRNGTCPLARAHQRTHGQGLRRQALQTWSQ